MESWMLVAVIVPDARRGLREVYTYMVRGARCVASVQEGCVVPGE